MIEKILYLQLLLLIFNSLAIGIIYPFKSIQINEKFVRFCFGISGIVSVVGSIFLFTQNFSEVNHILFNLVTVSLNKTNLFLYLFSTVVITVVSKFSFKYIHKEIGFKKFFLNLSLFWVGLFLFIFSGNYLSTFAGWELIGISSIFLISFYHYRKSPVLSSLYVVSFYKVADIILITSLLFLNHHDLLQNNPSYAPFIFACITISGLIKSASFPFTSWLPRSMEGPTPSSAIYYAALALNVGIILIIKFLPEILQHELSRNILLFSGIFTVFYSSFQGRIQNDIKTSLGYSSSAQIGFILIELYFNFKYLAIAHLFFNSILKTYQFLRTPSLLHIYHSMEGEYGKSFSKTGLHFEYLVPKPIRNFFYYLTFNHFYLDAFYNFFKQALEKAGSFTIFFFYPLVKNKNNISYKLLLWWVYYLLINYLVSWDALTFNDVYFDIIPISIFIISISILFEKNLNAFIALFSIYKILESFIVHGVHTHEPYKWLALLIVGLFIFLLVQFQKAKSQNKSSVYFLGSVTILAMLYFTNFPFLLQSLVNEHIIESFISNGGFFDLVFYCLANTFFNLALYNFIFSRIYIQEAIDG